MKIEIETNHDKNECETCGINYAQGGTVRIDGVEILRREAVAHCYGGTDYNEDELLVMALKKLGHDVFVDGERYHFCCIDDEYHKEADE